MADMFRRVARLDGPGWPRRRCHRDDVVARLQEVDGVVGKV